MMTPISLCFGKRAGFAMGFVNAAILCIAKTLAVSSLQG